MTHAPAVVDRRPARSGGAPASARPRPTARRPLHVGILGTSGAGKTTYQTALAYALVRQQGHDAREPLWGNPIGATTKSFLETRVLDLVEGRFPPATNDATDLTYYLATPKEAVTLSIKDYRGGATGEIFEGTGELPPSLAELAAYFTDCDAYLFLVNARVLILDDRDPEFVRFWSEFVTYKAVLRALIDAKPRSLGKITTPIGVVATQIDALELTGDNVARVDRQLEALTQELSCDAHYPRTFKVSAIGGHFLDSQGQKYPDARLEPLDVLAPVNFILEARRRRRRQKRRRTWLTVLIILLGGLLAAAVDLKVRADRHASAVEALLVGVPEASAAALEARLRELTTLRAEIGAARWFLTAAQEDADGTTEAQLTAALDDRAYTDVERTVNALLRENPNDLETIRKAIRGYTGREFPNEVRASRHLDDAEALLAEVVEAHDEHLWQRAVQTDSVEAYNTYRRAALAYGRHLDEALARIRELERGQFAADWGELFRQVDSSPDGYAVTVPLVHQFIQECPAYVLETLKPNPPALFERLVREWDQSGWRQLQTYYRDRVAVAGGAISGLEDAIGRYRAYLTRFAPYAELVTGVPHAKAAAKARIAQLETARVPRDYAIELVSGRFVGFEESEPDIYVVVTINGTQVFTNAGNVLSSNANPVWHQRFVVSWRAYDTVRVVVWDYDSIGPDDHVFQAESNDLDSLDRVLGTTVSFRKGEADFSVRFRRLGHD